MTIHLGEARVLFSQLIIWSKKCQQIMKIAIPYSESPLKMLYIMFAIKKRARQQLEQVNFCYNN